MHKRIGLVNPLEAGTAIFAGIGGFNRTTAAVGHKLRTIAYAQYRIPSTNGA